MQRLPAGDVVVVGGGHVDDRVVLNVEREVAADAAVRADRVDLGLLLLAPVARLAQVELALRHQRAGRTDGDAVAAVDAGRLGQRHVELGRDVRAEAAAGDRDRERVLGVGAAGLDALVTEDALRVVADVELVVDLHRLLDRERVGAEPIGLRLVPLDVRERLGRRREVAGRAEQLHHEPPARAHALGVGVHDHPVLDLARARGDEHARVLELDDADAAHVHRRQRVAVAERRRVDPHLPRGVEDRAALDLRW